MLPKCISGEGRECVTGQEAENIEREDSLPSLTLEEPLEVREVFVGSFVGVDGLAPASMEYTNKPDEYGRGSYPEGNDAHIERESVQDIEGH